jgi:hypothetical protein
MKRATITSLSHVSHVYKGGDSIGSSTPLTLALIQALPQVYFRTKMATHGQVANYGHREQYPRAVNRLRLDTEAWQGTCSVMA